MYIIKEAIEKWYHGSTKKIEKWTTDFMGEGIDQEGPGIYFTSDYDDAMIYTKKNSNDKDGFVHELELNFRKVLSVTVKPKKLELEKLIKSAKDYKETLENWGNESEYQNIKEALEAYLDYNDTYFEAIKSLANDFYRYDSKGYCEAMTKLGYDGVIVKKAMGVFHAIVWNSKIIKTI